MVDETLHSRPHRGPAAAVQTVFREACERVIHTRALLEDPRHLTRRHGSAVLEMLGAGLAVVESKLAAARSTVYCAGDDGSEAASESLAVVVAGLRQIHAHLGLLRTKWQLGTADLFARKLAAEGAPLPIPVLCPIDDPDGGGEVGAEFRDLLSVRGLEPVPGPERPIVRISTVDLADPLVWPGILLPMAAWFVAQQDLASQLHFDEGLPRGDYAARCTAAVAARLLGEPTYAAVAVKELLSPRITTLTTRGLPALAHATRQYYPCGADSTRLSLVDYFEPVIEHQRGTAGDVENGRERATPDSEERTWQGACQQVAMLLQAPLVAPDEEIDALVSLLDDGRPINARPRSLPDDFITRLDACEDAEQFYAAVQHVGEQPCSLASILAAGWRYKLLRTYPACDELMQSSLPWPDAIDGLAAHVRRRCDLLQQSVEAAHVQHVLTRWRDS